ncbi:hypothetical protein PIB30_088727 [Stylosanthes scabra]|uniref:Uncharacterized protein n=1 Tax=Stylosanthes scabra TaxID=79078 RepID=A0ABU6TW06_9FABA|nr:hypothetical protein [Stylosanthes scabra]
MPVCVPFKRWCEARALHSSHHAEFRTLNYSWTFTLNLLRNAVECCCGASCFLTSLSTAAWYSVNLWMIIAGIGELMRFSPCPASLLLVPPLLLPPLLDSLSVHHNRHCSCIFLTQDKDVRLGAFGLARTLKAYDFAYGCLKVTIARHAN